MVDALRAHNPLGPILRDNYRVNFNATESDGPLVLPTLPLWQTFVVISNLMQMFIERGLLAHLVSEDPHAHVAKQKSVCKCCVGRSDLDMDDLSVVGDSFDCCLNNLFKVLKWYKDCNLVLIWEKCHFMVKEGIALGHQNFEKAIEVDRSKLEVI